MTKVEFIRCRLCGNLFGVIQNSGVKPMCCNEQMEELVANSTEAAGEKHLPVIERKGNMAVVKVGSVAHPMETEHFIQWIALEQDGKMQRVQLNPGCAPEAEFAVDAGKPVTAYEYCNLHGLWKAQA